MFSDRNVEALLGPLRGNVRHFIDWREEAWESVLDDPQVSEDLSLLYSLDEEDFV